MDVKILSYMVADPQFKTIGTALMAEGFLPTIHMHMIMIYGDGPEPCRISGI